MNIIKDFAMADQITKRPGGFFLDILGLKFKILCDNKKFERFLKQIFFHFVCDEEKSDNGKQKRKINFKYQRDVKVINFKVKDFYADLFSSYDKIMKMCLEDLQDRFLLLHASSCVLDGQTYIFVGKSGAGKSRIVRRLVKGGAKYVGDDPVPISKKGEILTFPKPVLPRYTYRGRRFVKFFVPRSIGEPRPPYNFIIYEEDSEKDLRIQQLSKAEGAFELLKNTQNLECLEYKGSFDAISKVLQKSKVFRVNKPFYIRDFPKVLRIIRKV
jgi:hypothetical protein